MENAVSNVEKSNNAKKGTPGRPLNATQRLRERTRSIGTLEDIWKNNKRLRGNEDADVTKSSKVQKTKPVVPGSPIRKESTDSANADRCIDSPDPNKMTAHGAEQHNLQISIPDFENQTNAQSFQWIAEQLRNMQSNNLVQEQRLNKVINDGFSQVNERLSKVETETQESRQTVNDIRAKQTDLEKSLQEIEKGQGARMDTTEATVIMSKIYFLEAAVDLQDSKARRNNLIIKGLPTSGANAIREATQFIESKFEISPTNFSVSGIGPKKDIYLVKMKSEEYTSASDAEEKRSIKRFQRLHNERHDTERKADIL